jgi:hypothetical protein
VSNILTFRFPRLESGALTVVAHIDGAALAALAAAYETARGDCDPAGGYGGLVPEYFNYGPLDRYFLGGDGEAQYLLGCQCGEVGCWPLMGRITALPDVYQWSGFHNPFRPQRDYSGLGPFRFARAHYKAAVAGLAG